MAEYQDTKKAMAFLKQKVDEADARKSIKAWKEEEEAKTTFVCTYR